MPRLAAVCLVAVLAVLPVVVQGVYDGWHHVGANDHQTGFTNTSLISKYVVGLSSSCVTSIGIAHALPPQGQRLQVDIQHQQPDPRRSIDYS